MDEVKLYIGSMVTRTRSQFQAHACTHRDDPQFVGTTGYSVVSLIKALSRLGKPSALSVCYEARPRGY